MESDSVPHAERRSIRTDLHSCDIRLVRISSDSRDYIYRQVIRQYPDRPNKDTDKEQPDRFDTVRVIHKAYSVNAEYAFVYVNQQEKRRCPVMKYITQPGRKLSEGLYRQCFFKNRYDSVKAPEMPAAVERHR